METNKTHSSKSFCYYMYAIHRILGFFAVGAMLIYSCSGIILLRRTTDFMKRSTPVEMVVQPNLTADQLAQELKMKSLKPIEETDQTIFFADGQYDKATGHVAYLKKEVVHPFEKFIDYHTTSTAKSHWIAWVATGFAIILFLQAVTALLMNKPSSPQFKANMLYTGLGIAFIIIVLGFV